MTTPAAPTPDTPVSDVQAGIQAHDGERWRTVTSVDDDGGPYLRVTYAAPDDPTGFRVQVHHPDHLMAVRPAPEHITIDVAGAGALVTGTTKGSPAAELFASTRPWRWARTLGSWCLPRSLRPETVDWRVDQMAKALEAIGCTVTVTGAEDRETEVERVERRDARDRDLVEIHEAAAGRANAEGDGLWQQARDSAALIPFGQPILTDHYSAPAHRRHLDRIHRTEGRAVEAWREGEDRDRRAASARGRVAAAATRGQAPGFGRHNVQRGDLVRLSWGWFVAVRANAKTVTVPNSVYRDVDVLDVNTKGAWTTTVEWRKVREARRGDTPIQPAQPPDLGQGT